MQQLGNIPNFCRVNGYRDAKESFGSASGMSSWQGTFAVAEDQRRAVLDNALKHINILALQESGPLTQEEAKRCGLEIERIKASPVQQGDDEKATLLESAYFCKDVTLLHIAKCSTNINDLAELTKPHDDINLLDIWQQVLTDPVYFTVIRKVALRNAEMVNKNETPKTRLFDDLSNEFFSELKDRKKAEDYAFNLLGVMASNGNNSSWIRPCNHLKSKSQQAFSDAIELLGLSNMVLDSRSARNNFLYTYPKEVDSLCDYGKNYHFWMTAFLARYAAKQSGDVTASAAAAFSMNKGYQFLKVGNGRDRTRAFKDEAFSNYNNNMRLDLTQAAAGAWFGATSYSAKRSSLNREQFENGLRSLFQGVQFIERDPNFKFPSTSDPLSMIGTFSKWKTVINPDGAFKYFESQLGQN